MKGIIILLMISMLSTAPAQQQECLHGQIRETQPEPCRYLQFCYIRTWRDVCYEESQWGRGFNAEPATNIACTQLGYSNTGNEVNPVMSMGTTLNVQVKINGECTQESEGLVDCMVEPVIGLPCNDLMELNCADGCNTDGEIRLAGGFSVSEGRVEVCTLTGTKHHWVTVCPGDQFQDGAVCAVLGHSFEGAYSILAPSREVYPEHTLTCEQTGLNNMWHCEAQQVHCTSIEVWVNCNGFVGTDNKSLVSTTVEPQGGDTTSFTAGDVVIKGRITVESVTEDITQFTNGGSITSTTQLTAVIGVSAVLCVALAIGWIVSCVVLMRQRQSQDKINTVISTTAKQNYLQHNLSEQLYDEARVPAVGGEYSKLDREQGAAGYKADDISTYDYADHSQVRGDQPRDTHPKAVGEEVGNKETDDELYNAKEHTYAVVDKKEVSMKQVNKRELTDTVL